MAYYEFYRDIFSYKFKYDDFASVEMGQSYA